MCIMDAITSVGEWIGVIPEKKAAPKMPTLPPAPKQQEQVTAPDASEGYQDTQAMDNAREDERRRAALRTGRKSTILTNPLGVQTDANTQRKTLLGG